MIIHALEVRTEGLNFVGIQKRKKIIRIELNASVILLKKI